MYLIASILYYDDSLITSVVRFLTKLCQFATCLWAALDRIQMKLGQFATRLWAALCRIQKSGSVCHASLGRAVQNPKSGSVCHASLGRAEQNPKKWVSLPRVLSSRTFTSVQFLLLENSA